MSTLQHTYSGVTPRQIDLLMHAARVERAQAIRRFLARLFSKRREKQAWPVPSQPALSLHTGR